MKEETPAKKEMELLGNNPSPFPLLPGFPRLPGINPPTANGMMPTPTSNPAPSMPNLWPFIYNHITNLLPQLSIARMDPLSQVFSLRWNQHQTNMLSVFDKLLQSEAFCDVTLACDGGSLKCHKIVLAASSDYFQKLFIDNNSEHPIVFLKDVQVSQVKAILDYMYRGEVSVAQQELPALLRVAELLRVKGMIEENKEAKVEGESEKKEVRQGSTDSAPPNSVVPPTSSNGHTTSAPLSPHPPTSRPLVPPPGAIPPNFRPFLTPPGSTSTPPFPMWPLPGLLPGAYNLFNQRDRKDLSPGPKDRHKMASGSSSDKDLPLPPLIPREQGEEREGGAKSAGLNGDGSEDDRTPFPHDPRNPYNNDKSPNSQQQYAGGAGGHGNNGNMKLEGIAGYVPAQRLEWKRYKQYTRNDIMAAIEEVKTGKSALQVSKKFNIPSRTLYDKVKKMGISTGRQQQRKSMNSSFGKGSGQPSGPSPHDMFSPAAYSAAFPSMNMMGPLHHLPEGMRDMPLDNPYKNLMDKMREVRDDEDSRDTREARDRDDLDMGSDQRPKPKDLGPMPFSILPPHMLNMMERIKRGEEMEMEREEKDRMETSSPMNLSSEREESKRMSEGSFPNESPSPGSGDIDSPSQASPPSYSERDRAENLSPDRAQIDIRAQFLADLRRSAGGDGQRSPELDLTRSSAEFGLPPRKRKISQEVDARSTEGTSPKLNLQSEHKSLNGLEENNSAVVT